MTVSLESTRARIRVAHPSDAKRLADLAGQLGYPSTTKDIVRRLRPIERSALHAVFVAEAPDRQVIGWVHVYVCHLVESDPGAEIGGLVLDERYRGRGVGQLLMQRAEEWARRKKCRTVSLRSNVIRTSAHAFYEKLGYTHIKTQKAFRKIL